MSTVSAGVVTTMLQFIAGAGVDSARVRQAAGLRSSDLMDPDRPLDINALAAVFASAATDLDDSGFILHLCSQLDLEALGLISYVVLNAPTVHTGIHNMGRFAGTFVSGLEISLSLQQDSLVLQNTVSDLAPETASYIYEGGALLITRMLRAMTGNPEWRPHDVLFAHARPRNLAHFKRYFGVMPTFEADRNEIHVDAVILKHEVEGANRSILPLVEQQLQAVLGFAANEPAWLGRLKYLIAAALCDGHPSLVAMSETMGLTPRTLQRRLEYEGIVYRNLVQQIRLKLAMQYLGRGDIQLTEVAFLVGYSELSAFTNAFKRWTGQSPGQSRRSLDMLPSADPSAKGNT
ncbi:MAG: AraC family transcriptional regulator ligand-binding domain-containing protein [Pseudomonadota bacterium]